MTKKKANKKEKMLWVRVSIEDHRKIDYVCQILDVANSKFMRDISVAVANAIYKEIKERTNLISKESIK